MNALADKTSARDATRAGRGVLVIGAGGLSCPVLSVLVKSGVTRLTLVDDDRVELGNLHRQTLYDDGDVGRLKVEVATEKLARLAPKDALRVERVVDRFVPENALALCAGHALVVEGADNYATKFLAADAAQLSGVPIVQAGAVRFGGWALGVSAGPARSACVRCVFEDIPPGRPDTCSVSGVLGPVVGVLGALQAAIALQMLRGHNGAGVLWSYDALGNGLRRRQVRPRSDCALCHGQVHDLSPSRYAGACAQEDARIN